MRGTEAARREVDAIRSTSGSLLERYLHVWFCHWVGRCWKRIGSNVKTGRGNVKTERLEQCFLTCSQNSSVTRGGWLVCKVQ